MNNQNNKKRSIITIISTVIFVISSINFFYVFNNNFKIQMANTVGCCTMADDTEQDIMEKAEARERAQKNAVIAKDNLEKNGSLCVGIGIVCLLSLITSLVVSIVKKELSTTKVLVTLFLILNIFFVLCEMGF